MDTDLRQQYTAAYEKMAQVRTEIHKKVFGQEEMINQTLTCILAGGHALLVGPPGVGKTLLLDTLSTVMGLNAGRIQFTPDLTPSDITGSEIMQQDADGKRYLMFVEGPAFVQLLLADEINRASPRTQSALLEAMQEGQVTAGGKTRPLPEPFHVLATQNPLEQEGTYPLPEAQRDRFVMQVDVDYPDYETELKIGLSATANKPRRGSEKFNQMAAKNPSSVLEQRLTPEELVDIQDLVTAIPVSDELARYALNIIRACRPTDANASEMAKSYVSWPPGPRAIQNVLLTAKASALMRGDIAVSKADIDSVMMPVMKLRMELKHAQARKNGVTLENVLWNRAPAAGTPAPAPR